MASSSGADAAAFGALSNAVGLDLASYRRDHVARQIERACRREHVADTDRLVRVLQRDADAASRFRRGVAVSVSGLFRDADQFDLLRRDTIPELLARNRRLRVWSAGCADGSELVSIALLLHELGGLDGAFLLGSDVLGENVERARRFLPDGVDPAIRRHLRFEVRDLLREPPPPGRFGLILCRNVAIYFDPTPKRRLHAALADALARGGMLVLGRSERLARPGELGLRRVHDHAYTRDSS